MNVHLLLKCTNSSLVYTVQVVFFCKSRIASVTFPLDAHISSQLSVLFSESGPQETSTTRLHIKISLAEVPCEINVKTLC